MIIKVCGLKFKQNVLDISALDINMVGYNFYASSQRYVESPLPEIPTNIKKVGVFVNTTIDDIKHKTIFYKLDFAQLHGDEDVSYVVEIKKFIPVIKVFRIDENFDPKVLNTFEFCDFFLFDTATKQFGGSGSKFDWTILNTYDIQVPFLLSGGIGPEDLGGIKNIRHPKLVGVDINSKFEISPGLKDVEKVKSFVDDMKIYQHKIK